MQGKNSIIAYKPLSSRGLAASFYYFLYLWQHWEKRDKTSNVFPIYVFGKSILNTPTQLEADSSQGSKLILSLELVAKKIFESKIHSIRIRHRDERRIKQERHKKGPVSRVIVISFLGLV